MIARMTTLMRAMLVSYLPMLIVLLLCTGLNAYAQTTETTVAAQPDALRAPPPPPEDEPPFNNAQFVSQSVPTTMTAGTTYQVSVTMGNLGNRTWTDQEGFTLGSRNPTDNGTWGIGRVGLWRDNLPGALITFTFTVTAPAVPGSYNFQWGMLQEGVEWFGALSDNVVINVVAPAPLNAAAFVSQSVPGTMTVGTSYQVTVQMVNSGTTTWTSAGAYYLGSRNPYDNGTWGIGRIASAGPVAPGQIAAFTFNVTPPAAAGSYNFQWSMVQDGVQWFGPPSDNLVINVVAPAPAPLNGAQAVSMSIPALTQGQSATIAVTMQNSGNTTWPAGSNYKLGSKNPDENLIWGVQRVDLATSVAPGQNYTFTFPITAPAAGVYTMQWQMMQRYVEWFGGLASAAVTVNPPASGDIVTYIHTDALGSPVARSDSAGNIISRTSYEPYGRTAGGVDPTIGFTGHVNDVNTGLVYMQQRYYDPMAGRFLSVDPVTTDANTGDSFNRYAYVENNPYRYIDPDGRGPVDGLIKVLVKVVVAAVKTETKQVAKGAAKEVVKDGEKVAVEAAKRGPKTDPTAPHNAKIRELGDKVEAEGGEVLAGGGRKPEVLVPTPGGIKGGRRPDMISRDANGNVSATQVGRTRADGTPVKREVEALKDLNGPGQLPTNFESYTH